MSNASPSMPNTASNTSSEKLLNVAVWKFSSCDGCQLSIFNCEDELLEVTERINFSYFLEASSKNSPGPYDVSLVEGSISTEEEVHRIKMVRAVSAKLVTIGACASTGGIQALRNFANSAQWAKNVYPSPEFLSFLETCSGVSEHVPVDFELRGCPVSKAQLLETILALANHREPKISKDAVCVECKRQGVSCLMVTAQEPCLGPVTQAGCHALCPRHNRACFGCFGAKEGANTAAWIAHLKEKGLAEAQLARLLQTFHAWNAKHDT